MSHPTSPNSTLPSIYENQPTKNSYRSCRPASALLPIISKLEGNNKYRFALSRPSRPLRRHVSEQKPFQFMDLPPEVREKIYKLVWGVEPSYYFSLSVCTPSINIRRLYDRGRCDTRGNPLLFVSKQISKEAAHVLYSEATLRIDSAPSRKLETLSFLGNCRTVWFTATTRRISVRSGFNSTPRRNEAWVTGLKKFNALVHLEVLLDFNLSTDENTWKDSIINLLPFSSLDCQTILFRGHPNAKDDTKRDVEIAWRAAVSGQANSGPMTFFMWDYIHGPGRRLWNAEQ